MFMGLVLPLPASPISHTAIPIVAVLVAAAMAGTSESARVDLITLSALGQPKSRLPTIMGHGPLRPQTFYSITSSESC